MPGPGAGQLSAHESAATVALAGPRRWVDLDPVTAYAIVRLRVDVFVVEQECPFPDLDGRDLEPATEHRWVPGPAADAGGEVLAYLRVLSEPDGSRKVSRVVTAPHARGRGLAARLLAAVVADHGAGVVVLDAQSPLQGWYARFGFVVDGPGFLEDGIPHVPMRRGPTP